MIQNQTKCLVADNSGVKIAKCIGSVYKHACIGSVVLISAFETKSQLKKGVLFKGILIRSSSKIKHSSGQFIWFNLCAVVLLNTKNELLGTRIFGPVSKKLRKKKMVKLLSLAFYII